jgi:two-component system sensor histidine kinase RegB
MNDLSPGLLHTLAVLRWWAVAGQTLTVALVVHVWGLPLAAAPLWGGVAVLAAFNVWATHRAGRVGDSGPGEVLAHVAVDVAVLAWMIGWSGGAMNPFASLFLLPIAFVAVALPTPWVGATVALCGAGYALSAAFGRPLPHAHGFFGDTLDLHLAGMAVTFALSAAVVVYFLTHLAAALRQREQELARLREQFARNEGIVALATHAASVAHELNTPLGSLTLMLEDQLADAPPGSAQRDDVLLMATLVNACRDRVRELAAPADRAAVDVRPLADQLETVVERWRLLRPTVQLVRSGVVGDGGIVDAGFGHLLQALLNNAADASARMASTQVDLHLESAASQLSGAVRDYGPGFETAEPLLPGTLFRTTKPDGMGVGLALSHATIERLGGELSMEAADGGGVVVRFRLPLKEQA